MVANRRVRAHRGHCPRCSLCCAERSHTSETCWTNGPIRRGTGSEYFRTRAKQRHAWGWGVTEGAADALVRELARSLPAALDDDALADLASRLRPFLGVASAADDRVHELLSATQAARAASVHVETIRRAIRAGDLAIAGQVGRSARIAPEELRRWLRKAEHTGATSRRITVRSRSRPPASSDSLLLALTAESGGKGR
jgi:excisionase family DNA binding protein